MKTKFHRTLVLEILGFGIMGDYHVQHGRVVGLSTPSWLDGLQILAHYIAFRGFVISIR